MECGRYNYWHSKAQGTITLHIINYVTDPKLGGGGRGGCSQASPSAKLGGAMAPCPPPPHPTPLLMEVTQPLPLYICS